MPAPEPAFARRWRTKFNAALDRSSPSSSSTAQDQKFTFPLAQYLSLHLVLSAFLLFSFTALPRSQAWLDGVLGLEGMQTGQRVSADRPEWEWLTRLTVDPRVTMGWSCAGLVVSLGWWSVHLRKWWVAARIAENPAARAQIEAEDTFTLARNATLATIASTTLLAPLLILLGAPSTTHHAQTILLALHLSLLIVLPPAYALGIPSIYESGSFERYRLTRLFCELAPKNHLERATVYPIITTLLVTWLSAIPLPLDWDRPWQSYPLPPAFGSIVGFILGGVAVVARGVFEEAVEASRDVVRQAVEGEKATAAEEKGKRKKKKGGKAA